MPTAPIYRAVRAGSGQDQVAHKLGGSRGHFGVNQLWRLDCVHAGWAVSVTLCGE